MTAAIQPPPASHSPLTVIITTSPTPSAPSTELLSSVLASFHTHCLDLLACAVIVVFDTYDHITPIARFKRAQVTKEDAAAYSIYKDNVKALILAEYGRPGAPESVPSAISKGIAEYGSPLMAESLTTTPFTVTQFTDKKIAFVEPEARLGFALAVRTALRLATTPYVWIQQHDWRLAADVPVGALLQLMRRAQEDPGGGSTAAARDGHHRHPPVTYVTFSSPRMMRYAASALVSRHRVFRELTAKLKQDFVVALPSPLPSSSPAIAEAGGDADFGPEADPGTAMVTTTATVPATATVTLPLTPLFMWLDKPHLACRTHYLNRVFPTRLAVSRGDFIEDTVGHRARTQMKKDEALWARWGCWIYYPGDGEVLGLRHLQGRHWRGADKEEQMAVAWRERNAQGTGECGGKKTRKKLMEQRAKGENDRDGVMAEKNGIGDGDGDGDADEGVGALDQLHELQLELPS